MSLRELIKQFLELAVTLPDATVRMETYNCETNCPAQICVSADKTKITIIGDGIPQKY